MKIRIKQLEITFSTNCFYFISSAIRQGGQLVYVEGCCTLPEVEVILGTVHSPGEAPLVGALERPRRARALLGPHASVPPLIQPDDKLYFSP